MRTRFARLFFRSSQNKIGYDEVRDGTTKVKCEIILFWAEYYIELCGGAGLGVPGLLGVKNAPDSPVHVDKDLGKNWKGGRRSIISRVTLCLRTEADPRLEIAASLALKKIVDKIDALDRDSMKGTKECIRDVQKNGSSVAKKIVAGIL